MPTPPPPILPLNVWLDWLLRMLGIRTDPPPPPPPRPAAGGKVTLRRRGDE